MIPQRVCHVEEARRRFGDRADRLFPFLLRTDPLADDVVETIAAMPVGFGWSLFKDVVTQRGVATSNLPPSFRAFFAAVEHVPAWVDQATLNRGGEVLLRTGFFGGIVLAVESLVYGYCSPAGNKPLVFSGRLRDQASRRLSETGRFVQATCLPGGLERHGDGFAITLRVRLMHAQVRRLLKASGRWDTPRWGEPINQHDMAATTLLFSMAVIDGLRKFGFRLSRGEVESYLHLWRYSGYLIGVDPELLTASEDEAQRLWDLILLTEGEPDDDARLLTAALLEAPRKAATTSVQRVEAERRIQVSYGFCRGLLGEELANKLAVPTTPWRYLVPALRVGVAQAERGRSLSSYLRRRHLAAGTRYWKMVVEQGLGTIPADFALPTGLSQRALDGNVSSTTAAKVIVHTGVVVHERCDRHAMDQD